MKWLASALALAACTDVPAVEEKNLADLSELTVVVDADVGVPQDPLGAPNVATGVSVFIDYPGATCYSLHTSVTARIDGQVPDVLVTGGLESSSCEKPILVLAEPLAPRDVSTITLADASATYSMTVGRLFVNPKITLGATLAPGSQIARVEDPRAISAATVWWRSADGTQGFMKPADASTQGELRFTIPAGISGTGTLGVTVTIRDNAVSCSGFQSCKAIVRGGGVFAVTVR